MTAFLNVSAWPRLPALSLAIDRPVMDGIQRERELLAPLHDQADLVPLLSLHELRRLAVGHCACLA